MDVLRRPEYRRLWAATRKRLEGNGLVVGGSALVLKDPTAAEADAIAGLLGVRRPAPGEPIKVNIGRLDQSLLASAVGVGLIDVLERLGGPLIDRRTQREDTLATQAAGWVGLLAHRAIEAEPRLAEWLEELRRRGLARRLAGVDELAAVETALEVARMVGDATGGWRLPVLAAKVTGDAHGLDRGRAAGTLAVNALAFLDDRDHPKDAADWRRTWADAGVACDDLSCDVLVLNLPGWPMEPLRLTLRQAMRWEPQPHGDVFVCENPAVLAAAEDDLGTESPTVVCVDGMPSTAALTILEGLASCGSTIRYHGDFDWRGLTIADVLMRKIPAVEPWAFGAADYEAAVAAGLGTVALTGPAIKSRWDPHLAAAMANSGVAVYEEQVLVSLLRHLT